jgi:hypothetical protein
MCCALSANFGVQVGPITSDMWFLLEADAIDADNNDRAVYVQCDRVEDGLRAIYNWVADGGFDRSDRRVLLAPRAPERRTRGPPEIVRS